MLVRIDINENDEISVVDPTIINDYKIEKHLIESSIEAIGYHWEVWCDDYQVVFIDESKLEYDDDESLISILNSNEYKAYLRQYKLKRILK